MSHEQPQIGWIGLGAMGTPMVRAAAAAGFAIRVFDVSDHAVAAVSDIAIPARTSEDTVMGAEIVVIMVATPEQLNTVLFGDDGIASTLSPDTTLLVMSTVGPAAIDELVTATSHISKHVVDAPVSGGVARAATGDLLIMAAGADDDVKAVQSLLDALASTVAIVGERPGDGQRFKVINQLLCGVHIAAAGEALALADSMGLDPQQVHTVLGAGAAASFMFQDRGERMTQNAFEDVRSALAIFVKDMGLVSQAARSVHQEVPLASSAEQLYLRGARLGLGRLDDSVVYKILRGSGNISA
ncbi:NAD(P)-dependent oxidoreductase [Mariniluteicoccus endophyticus]